MYIGTFIFGLNRQVGCSIQVPALTSSSIYINTAASTVYQTDTQKVLSKILAGTIGKQLLELSKNLFPGNLSNSYNLNINLITRFHTSFTQMPP